MLGPKDDSYPGVRFASKFIKVKQLVLPWSTRMQTVFHSIHIARSCLGTVMWCVRAGVFSASLLYSHNKLRLHIDR